FPEVLSLHAVWNQVLYDYRPILEEKTIHFKNGLKNNQHIWADLNSIKVVFRNVLDNAIKFSNPKSEIHLKAETKGNQCTIELRDFGMGMETTEGSTQPDTQGKLSTGLGLTLCIEFVRRNQGRFTIESEKDGGTSVFITLYSNELKS
ncbi:MAG: HAMP domain-containing sensor histidine kinase, partial [Bacteroidota bacterium]